MIRGIVLTSLGLAANLDTWGWYMDEAHPTSQHNNPATTTRRGSLPNRVFALSVLNFMLGLLPIFKMSAPSKRR